MKAEVQARLSLRRCLSDDAEANRIRKPDPSVHRDLRHGWLLPAMLDLEAALWGRWDYWMQLQMGGKLPEVPIPQIDFLGVGDSRCMKMLDATLNCITGYGDWTGWGSETNFRYFLDWLLYGLGHPGQPEPPPEPDKGASDRMYQVFNVGQMLLYPYDYFGDIGAEMRYGRSAGFFPTPMTVVQLMVGMTMGEEDCRDKTVCDPCCGTGRMPMVASNYSLRLYGMDINAMMVKATLVNGYLYAPWLVRPIGWLDGRPDDLGPIAQMMAEAAPPHQAAAIAASEHDREDQWQYFPIVKRRMRKGEPEILRAYQPLFSLK